MNSVNFQLKVVEFLLMFEKSKFNCDYSLECNAFSKEIDVLHDLHRF